MSNGRVLVAGANGQLGGVIARKLIAGGVPVRALGRNAEKLGSIQGAEIAAVDLMNLSKLTEACRGVTQIVSTANNNMGRGATSPGRMDLTAHQNLCAAARNTGVRRLIYVSARGIEHDSPVDIFRVKWYIEDAIKRSGVPHLILRPSAFMDIWIDRLLADGIRRTGTATIFGDGRRAQNYIAVDDVAEFAVRAIARAEIVKETIDVGGPSDATLNDLATRIEQQLKTGGKRRHIPVLAMRLLPPIVRPFSEVAARLMTLGYFAAAEATPFPGWKAAADRFGISPRTVESYIATLR
jgi:uncharacterized protein YbjT (DUF2867 family)